MLCEGRVRVLKLINRRSDRQYINNKLIIILERNKMSINLLSHSSVGMLSLWSTAS